MNKINTLIIDYYDMMSTMFIIFIFGIGNGFQKNYFYSQLHGPMNSSIYS